MSTILLLTFFSFIYGSAATHHVYRNLQGLSYDSSNQPYRTACNNGGKLLSINGVTATQVSFTCYNLVKILIIIKVLNYVQDDACNNFKKIIYTIMLKE